MWTAEGVAQIIAQLAVLVTAAAGLVAATRAQREAAGMRKDAAASHSDSESAALLAAKHALEARLAAEDAVQHASGQAELLARVASGIAREG